MACYHFIHLYKASILNTCSILDASSFPWSFMDNELLLTCFCGAVDLLEVWYARTLTEFQKPDFNRDTQIRLNFFILALNCNYSDYEVRKPRLSKSKMCFSAVLQKKNNIIINEAIGSIIKGLAVRCMIMNTIVNVIISVVINQDVITINKTNVVSRIHIYTENAGKCISENSNSFRRWRW